MSSPRTYPCPSCREFVNDSMTTCPFCSAPLDPQVALSAVEAQEKINRACNDASLIRNLAGVMWVCFFLRFLPFISCPAGIAMLILFLLVPVRLVMWQMRFGSIQTSDVDYKQGKRNVLIALGLWALVIVAQVVVEIFFVGVSLALQ
jgi:hypothetical protein